MMLFIIIILHGTQALQFLFQDLRNNPVIPEEV